MFIFVGLLSLWLTVRAALPTMLFDYLTGSGAGGFKLALALSLPKGGDAAAL